MEEPIIPPPPPKRKRGIFSFQPRGAELEFLQNLVKQKGNITTALQYCVSCAMGKAPVADQADAEAIAEYNRLLKENESQAKFINEYIVREKQFRAEIESLKSQINKPKSSDAPTEVKKDSWSW